ncbi:MAG: helix-hairpin-helix domain-containing protein, partial [Candidatus Amesbacteria bacterium]|nr:helix-hairpin-helix domain-containing protein [Candidatus Amesbacteria bacterium]
MQADKFYSKHKIELILAGSGLFFILLGSLSSLKPYIFPPAIQILNKNIDQKEMMVDIQGAITRPGVYRLVTGDRTQDLLDMAGGLLNEADTKWVETNLNRAKKVSDGEKIYIPYINDKSQMTNVKSNSININAATKSELEAIAGIGAVTAEKIINGRPYQELAELVSRKIISAKLYTQI